MKGRIITTFALLTIAPTPQTAQHQGTHSSVFLAYDDGQKQWCAFKDESTWRSRVDSTGATSVSTLNYSDSRLASVDVTTEDQTGDWTVFDHYILSQAGELARLERTSNILPGRRSVLETYDLVQGKAQLTNRKTKALVRGEKPTSETWLPSVKVATRVTEFQFAPLARMKYSEFSNKDSVCVAARAGAP